MVTDHARIEILGIEATGFHGVFDFEKRDGQIFRVDVRIWLADGVFERAAGTDDVSETVHYGELANTVAALISGQPYDLIETLASVIADACLADAKVASVEVTVHKPQAPIEVPFGDVRVCVRRSRP